MIKYKMCIFFGNGDVTKGCKLFNLKTWKLIVNRNILFLENESWTWTQKQNKEKEFSLKKTLSKTMSIRRILQQIILF